MCLFQSTFACEWCPRHSLSDCWSKVDLERSVCCVFKSDNVRSEVITVLVDKSKKHERTGCGPLPKTEQEHANNCALTSLFS